MTMALMMVYCICHTTTAVGFRRMQMDMPDARDLPPSEFEIMRVVWDMGRATVREVHDELTKERKLAYTSVASLMNRLRDKGYLAVEGGETAYVYHPLISREQVLLSKVDDLVTRVLGGNLAPLALYIAQNRNLTPEQMTALEEILRSQEKDEG